MSTEDVHQRKRQEIEHESRVGEDAANNDNPDTARRRPTCVTVISLLQIIAALALGELDVAYDVRDAFPQPFSGMLVVYGMSAAYLLVGIGMLSGWRWCRRAFLWLIPISLIGGMISSRVVEEGPRIPVLLGAVYYMVALKYLWREDVKQYFGVA